MKKHIMVARSVFFFPKTLTVDFVWPENQKKKRNGNVKNTRTGLWLSIIFCICFGLFVYLPRVWEMFGLETMQTFHNLLSFEHRLPQYISIYNSCDTSVRAHIERMSSRTCDQTRILGKSRSYDFPQAVRRNRVFGYFWNRTRPYPTRKQHLRHVRS